MFDYLTRAQPPALVAYTPAGLDPRYPGNHEAHPTMAFRADLETLRSRFEGLVLYGYQESSTPRIMALAKDLGYEAVILGIWQPKSAAEIDGVADLVRQFHDDFVMGVVIGNEGIIFGRYEEDDLRFALNRLRSKIPADIPITTSEPWIGYESKFIRGFGDFLAPNLHPVIDRADLGPAEAAAWAVQEALELARRTGRPVLLKETGFPHGGAPAYSESAQLAFWTAFNQAGPIQRVKGDPGSWLYLGVAFEAFDLTWKADESGMPIEGQWGLFSADRKPYPAASLWNKGD